MRPTLHSELKQVSEHMQSLGLGALAHASTHAAFYTWQSDNWSELSVIQAAHAAEILIKARIAEEHPLLIFNNLPRHLPSSQEKLGMQDLIENGRTYQYQDLPDILWASTGLRISDADLFKSFGKLRNTIQHFAPPADVNFSEKTLEFIFGVIDPFINDCWGLFAVDYHEESEPYVYYIETLVRMNIEFLVSSEAKSGAEYSDLQWPEDNPEYTQKMKQRLGR